MKKLLASFLLLLVGVGLGGCTMTETRVERDRRIANNWRIQSRLMVEDWDYFWLLEKPSALSRHHIRTGSTE